MNALKNPICADDKKIYKKFNLQKVISKEVNAYYTSHDYCVLCNASQLKSDVNLEKFLFFVPFSLIFSFFFGLFLAFLIGPGFLFTISLIFSIFIVLVIVSTIFSLDLSQTAGNEAKIFKSSLNSYSNDSIKVISNSFKSDLLIRPSSNFCLNCESNLSSNVMFCQNCGELIRVESFQAK